MERDATKLNKWRLRWEEAKKNDRDLQQRAEFMFEKKTYGDDLPSPNWQVGDHVATRSAFGDIIALWADHLPNLIGGSADLEPSNMTAAFAAKVGDLSRENPAGRNINFGVREFPMTALSNGLALYGGFIPFDATFLSFADYSRPALRLGAIQRVRVIHEFTHDSFFLGEDGPTHQPVEQVMSLRAMPDLYLMRPADGRETEVMLRVALDLDRSVALCLSRQKLPILDLDQTGKANIARGAYVVFGSESGSTPAMVIMATGSEVALALEVANHLVDSGQFSQADLRVISMPCWELFAKQDLSYRNAVLAPDCQKRVSIEAGVGLGWERYVGNDGLVISMDTYGASAPAAVLARHYGFTKEAVLGSPGRPWLPSLTATMCERCCFHLLLGPILSAYFT